MKAMTPREQRLVAIAVLVALIAAVWLGVVQPVIDGFGERADRREELKARYIANERLVSRIGSLRKVAEQQQRDHAKYAIAATDAEQGGEMLRERMEQALAKAGGELRSSQAVEAESGWVRASASATLTNAQMIDWIALLMADPPYLSLEGLNVNADRAMNSNHLDLMDVTIEAAIPLEQTAKR